jgi:hypothetical protein
MRVRNKAERVALNKKHEARVQRFADFRKTREAAAYRTFKVDNSANTQWAWHDWRVSQYESDNVNCEE